MIKYGELVEYLTLIFNIYFLQYETGYERDVRLIYEGQNSMHQILRGLHSKTGELTTEVNNLHSAVNLKSGGGGTATGDGPTKSEVNRLISLQNEVHTSIRDLQYVILNFLLI